MDSGELEQIVDHLRELLDLQPDRTVVFRNFAGVDDHVIFKRLHHRAYPRQRAAQVV